MGEGDIIIYVGSDKKRLWRFITKEIDDETAIRVSPRWFLEVSLSIWWVKALKRSGNKSTSIRI